VIEINIPTYLQPYAGDQETIEVSGNTVGECLDHLIRQFPGMKKMLFDAGGKLHNYVGIYINGEDAYPNELARPLKDSDKLDLLYIIGGG
jgi:molybdopterin converting factor small subunit